MSKSNQLKVSLHDKVEKLVKFCIDNACDESILEIISEIYRANIGPIINIGDDPTLKYLAFYKRKHCRRIL